MSPELEKPLRSIAEVEADIAKTEATWGGMDEHDYKVQARDIREMLPDAIKRDCDALANSGRLSDLREVHTYITALLDMKEAARPNGPSSRQDCCHEPIR